MSKVVKEVLLKTTPESNFEAIYLYVIRGTFFSVNQK